MSSYIYLLTIQILKIVEFIKIYKRSARKIKYQFEFIHKIINLSDLSLPRTVFYKKFNK